VSYLSKARAVRMEWDDAYEAAHPLGKHETAPTDELHSALTGRRGELLAGTWDDSDAAAAFATTLRRLRDVTGTTGDQRSANLWEAVNAALFARDRAALDVALRDLETYTLSTFPPDASAVLAELKGRAAP
jgi:hypothetical protein